MLKLYFAPGSIACACATALFEAGVPFEPVLIDTKAGAQLEESYLAVNPKSRVPALETQHGILTETIAILEYACPGLVPSDPWQAARMREINTYLASTAHVNHAHKMRGHRWADAQSSWDDMTAKVPETMTASAAYLESKVAGPLAIGSQITLADPYLYAVTNWLPGDGVTLSDYPKLETFRETMEGRSRVMRAKREGYFG